MAESDERLIACLAYSLIWEIAGTQAVQHWDGVRAYVRSQSAITETERWICELYEESSPSAQEENSIIARINARIDHPRKVVDFRRAILGLLPSQFLVAAEKHRLMNSLALPQGYSRLRTWLAEYKLARLSPRPQLPPLATREAAFQAFIELPDFMEAFRKYWHTGAKNRNTKETRVLVCLSAALGQILPSDDDSDSTAEWIHRLARMGHYSEQTRDDVSDLCEMLSDASYDCLELGYLLFSDAKAADRAILVEFCQRYAAELTGSTRDFMQGLQPAF